MRAGIPSIPTLIRFICHIPTAFIGIWSSTFVNQGVVMPGFYNRIPHSQNILQGLRVTGVAGWMIFCWNMAMLIPATKLQGLALGLLATVDITLVLVLVAGIVFQAFYLPLTYPACDDHLPGHGHLITGSGSRTSTFDETSREHCRAMVRNWAFCITVAVLYLLCALINLRIGFKGAQEDARLGKTSATDVWIIDNFRKAKRAVGMDTKSDDRLNASSRSAVARPSTSGEESIGLMNGEQRQEGYELGGLGRPLHKGSEDKAD